MKNEHIDAAIAILDNMEHEARQVRVNLRSALVSLMPISDDDSHQLKMAFDMLGTADTFINQVGTELRQVKG